MQEQHRLAMGAYFHLAQHPRALPRQRVASGGDVRNLEAEMMDAAIGIALEEIGDGGRRTQRAQQFHLAARQFDKNGGDAVVWLVYRGRDLRAQGIAVSAVALARSLVAMATWLVYSSTTVTRVIGFLPRRSAHGRNGPRPFERPERKRRAWATRTHNSTTVTRVMGFLPHPSCAARRAARRTFSAK